MLRLETGTTPEGLEAFLRRHSHFIAGPLYGRKENLWHRAILELSAPWIWTIGEILNPSHSRTTQDDYKLAPVFLLCLRILDAAENSFNELQIPYDEEQNVTLQYKTGLQRLIGCMMYYNEKMEDADGNNPVCVFIHS